LTIRREGERRPPIERDLASHFQHLGAC
jgi:hypothetical protein